MTRDDFNKRAIRELEKKESLPQGWYGRYTDAQNGAVRVFFSSNAWTVQLSGKRVSRHDSRVNAFRAGKRLLST